MSLPPSPHLTSLIYSLLAVLLSPPPNETTSKAIALSNLSTIVESLLTSPPDIKSSATDIPSYLSALTSALVKLSLQDPASLPDYLPRGFNLVFKNILLAPNASPSVLSAASDAVGSQGIIRHCLNDEMIISTVNYSRDGSMEEGGRRKQKTPFLARLIASLTRTLDTQAQRIAYFLPIFTALISRLRLRVTVASPAEIDPSGGGRTAAEELLLDVIRTLGDLRTQNGFAELPKLDEVVGMAIEVIGVEGILRTLPLNIEPDE